MSDSISYGSSSLEALRHIKDTRAYCEKQSEEKTTTIDALCFRYVNKTAETLRKELDCVFKEQRLFYHDLFTLATEVYISLEILSKREEFTPRAPSMDKINRDDIKKVCLITIYELLGIEAKKSRATLGNDFQRRLFELIKSGTEVPNGKTWADFENDSISILEQGMKAAEEIETFVGKIKEFQSILLTS